MEKALQIFEARQERIFNHNKRSKSYKQAVNIFTDLAESELKPLNGFRMSIFSSILAVERQIEMKNDIPESIDWRDEGIVTPVQHQGSICASCWVKIFYFSHSCVCLFSL